MENLISNKGWREAKNLLPITWNFFKKNYANNADSDFALLTRKSKYPYCYMTNYERFSETCLPSRDSFYSDLSRSHLSEEDYEFAQSVWNTFRIENLGKYMELYVALDTCLLADVFESFRTVSNERYSLDPVNYLTLASFAFDAMLRKTNVTLELFTDADMYLFIERGLRGGVCSVMQREAKASNPRTGDETGKSWIVYYDANNLYGGPMRQYLPEKEFEWVTESEIASINIQNVADDGETGYILEVDLHYPVHLHDAHLQLPLAPENMRIKETMLSPHQKSLLETFGKKIPSDGVLRLIPNLYDKNNYVVHYRTLKFYLSMGLQLKKIHRAIRFKQSPWLEPYIQMNMKWRGEAQTAFQKSIYKVVGR